MLQSNTIVDIKQVAIEEDRRDGQPGGSVLCQEIPPLMLAGLVVTVIVGVKMLGFEIVPPPSMTDQVVALTV